MRVLLIAIFALLTVTPGHAADGKISELSAIDRQYMQDAKDELNNVAQRYMGRQFNGDPDNDKRLLQQMLDRKVVRHDQTRLLQAMGYILGDVLIKEHRGVRWVVYEDKVGRSRALAVDNKPDVLFPATSISRRAEVGVNVDVQAVYDKLVDELEWIKQRFYVR